MLSLAYPKLALAAVYTLPATTVTVIRTAWRSASPPHVSSSAPNTDVQLVEPCQVGTCADIQTPESWPHVHPAQAEGVTVALNSLPRLVF